MIEYALIDIDDNEFPLNDDTVSNPVRGSFTYASDPFSNDNRVVPNSALPGSTKLGKTRLLAKELSFTFTRTHEDDQDFRDAENAFITFPQKTVAIVDKTNGMSAPVAIPGYTVDYGPGSHKLLSDNGLTVQMLSPFWKDLVADNVAQSIGVGATSILLSNTGNLVTPPIITLTANAAITQIQIYIDETKDGIQLDDALFGTIAFNEMIIDCEQGRVLLEGVDRTESILPASGYFDIPVGDSTLKIVTTAIMDLSMDFNKRYYV